MKPVPVKPIGFTLAEVMVVLVIIGLSATFVTLGFDRLQSDRLEKQAGAMSDWLQQLSDNAILNGAVYGAWRDGDDGKFYAAYYHHHQWWRLDADDEMSISVSSDVTVTLEAAAGRQNVGGLWRAQAGEAIQPDIIFFPSGMTLPERFELREADTRREARIERNDDGIFSWHLDPLNNKASRSMPKSRTQRSGTRTQRSGTRNRDLRTTTKSRNLPFTALLVVSVSIAAHKVFR